MTKVKPKSEWIKSQCSVCSSVFQPFLNRKAQKYCSKKCADKIHDARIRVRSPLHRFNDYKRKAIKRGLSFNISFSFFESKVLESCFYCSESISKRGLDRIDNSVGYKNKNVVSCCWPCNKLKGSKEFNEFVSQCIKIGLHCAKRREGDTQ